MTNIVNLSQRPDLLKALATNQAHDNIVRIDRQTEWGNPFKIGQDGNREDVIKNYRQHLYKRVQNGDVSLQSLAALKDKTLACWCVPKNCHGQVLANAATWAATKLQTTQTQPLTNTTTPIASHQIASPEPILTRISHTTPSHTAQLTYAGIGARATPPQVLDSMTRLAKTLANDGWHLHSGGAKGADTAFATGTPLNQREIYRPPTRNKANLDASTVVLTPEQNERCTKFAASLHPAWDRCEPYTRLLHARNAAIILGPNLDTPVSAVLCWTPGAQLTGGTAMAMRMAKHHNIPIFNLAASPREAIYPELQRIAQASQTTSPQPGQTTALKPRDTAEKLINDWLKHHHTTLAHYSTNPCHEPGYATLIERTLTLAPINKLPQQLRQQLVSHDQLIATWEKRLDNINDTWTRLTQRSNSVSPFYEPAYANLRAQIREFSETVRTCHLPPNDKNRFHKPLQQYLNHDHCVRLGLAEIKTFANLAWTHVHSDIHKSAHPTSHPDYSKWENRAQQLIRAGHEALKSPLSDHRAHINTTHTATVLRALESLQTTLRQDQHYLRTQANLAQTVEPQEHTIEPPKPERTQQLQTTQEETQGISL